MKPTAEQGECFMQVESIVKSVCGGMLRRYRRGSAPQRRSRRLKFSPFVFGVVQEQLKDGVSIHGSNVHLKQFPEGD